MSGTDRNTKNYVGYEYKEILIDANKVSQYLDGYENFGWIVDENNLLVKETGKVMLRLKRDRKIMNKVELTRLQRHFEDCMNQIEALDKSRTSMATVLAIAIGLIGTAFMAGSTFAVVNEPPIIWLCILLALPGFAGWIAPYFTFRAMVRKRENIVTPLIEDKYDEIYTICEKGSRLL